MERIVPTPQGSCQSSVHIRNARISSTGAPLFFRQTMACAVFLVRNHSSFMFTLDIITWRTLPSPGRVSALPTVPFASSLISLSIMLPLSVSLDWNLPEGKAECLLTFIPVPGYSMCYPNSVCDSSFLSDRMNVLISFLPQLCRNEIVGIVIFISFSPSSISAFIFLKLLPSRCLRFILSYFQHLDLKC